MNPIKGMFAIRGNHSVFLSRANLIRSTNKIRLLFIAMFSKINTGESSADPLSTQLSFENTYSDKLYSLRFSDKAKQIPNSLSTNSVLSSYTKNDFYKPVSGKSVDTTGIVFRFNHSLV
jgi:hypothetical protein